MPGKAKEVRPFTDWLTEQRNGVLLLELGESLNELVEAVDTHGKGGAITLKINVKPSGKGTQGAVVVSDTVTVKKPEGDRPEVFYFVDGDHNLARANPNQPSFDTLREVDAATGELLRQP